MKDKREEYVLDCSLECCPIDEINHVFGIALMCLEPEPSGRPTMAEVVRMLEQKRPARPLTTATFREGDTGESDHIDSIVASTSDSKPSDETET